MRTEGPIRIMAIDDHDIVLRGLHALTVTSLGQLEWLVGATDIRELVGAMQGRHADVCVVDLSLGADIYADDVIRRLAPLADHFLVYTSSVQPVPIRAALQAGATGLALKSDPEEALVEAIVEVANGNFAVSSDLAFVLATDEQLVPHLAPRELEALRLLAAGVPKKVIGRKMDPPVESSTVATYFNRISQRYLALGRNASGTHAAIREATRDGYLEL